MSKIYTKTGDKGRTGTFSGRMGKGEQLAEALGAIDELNSWVGVCRMQSPTSPPLPSIEKELKRIQTNLLTIGSGLAGSEKRLSNREIKRLELLIDRLTENLPKLSNFIYPVGHLQVARAVCRRAERETVRFMNEDLKFKNKSMPVLKYLNRLSDALFTMGRWINNKTGIEEEVWRGKF